VPKLEKSRVGAFDLARGALIGCYFNSYTEVKHVPLLLEIYSIFALLRSSSLMRRHRIMPRVYRHLLEHIT
jgi:hypothetical protein